MNIIIKLGFVVALSVTTSVASASIQGPDYPPPGGVTFSGSGSGTNGTATWNYSNFNTSGLSSLYFGLNQLDYGAIGAGLHGTANAFSLNSVSGTTAEWRADTQWKVHNSPSNLHINATTRLVMTITGLGTNPWITNLASIGLDVGFGDLGAVADNSSGLDFTLQWRVEANTGSGWQAINSVQQAADHNGLTRTNFATGFYSEAAVVPEPTTFLVWSLLGLTSTHLLRRRCKV